MIDDVMLNSDVLLHLTDIRTKDNNLFVHLVNVCIISVMVGVQVGLAKTRYGSGEPRGMEGKDINFLSKIVAVANDYDHLISDVEEGTSLFPHEACERIMGLTNIRYDHQVVWKFLRCVAFYPTGIQVKLNDGSIGVVIGQHKGLPQRPIVRTYRSDGDDFSFKEVDLAKETTTFITKVFT